MQLLYVDDERINLMLFEHACSAIDGVQVATAASGTEALEVARDAMPQLLVIDLHLPDTDGLALLRALRALPGLAQVPAFLCSADDDPALRRQAAEAGFAGCWPKPVDIGQLRQSLSALGLAPAA
ncbi:MAG: response regulator [Burkholderiales bacterium]|nr:response regulator [Burkholderiales bacterium]